MTVNENTGTREFRVDFAGGLPGAPFEGPGELVIETGPPDDRPHRVTARFYVREGLDLQVRFPRALKGTPFEPRGLAFANAAAKDRLVVSYEATPELLARLTGGLSTLPALQAYVIEAPDLFDFAGYELESVAIEAAG